MDLGDSRALLTGAAGGLAGHIAPALAAKGVTLALSDLPGEALDARTEAIRSAGARAETVPADLLDPTQRDSLVEAAEEAVGPVDILVNNAGVEITAPFTEFTEVELERIVAINLTVPMALTRQVIPGMLERGRGHVVSVASLAGKISPAYMAPYGITKAGVVAMTQALRAEHAEDPIGFSVICPGFVQGQGMIEPLEAANDGIPGKLGTSPPELVGRAVVRSVQRDLPEIVITHRRPLRLLLAISALSPRLGERLARSTGAHEVFRKTAEHRGRMGEAG